jgi:hypothetical protein
MVFFLLKRKNKESNKRLILCLNYSTRLWVWHIFYQNYVFCFCEKSQSWLDFLCDGMVCVSEWTVEKTEMALDPSTFVRQTNSQKIRLLDAASPHEAEALCAKDARLALTVCGDGAVQTDKSGRLHSLSYMQVSDGDILFQPWESWVRRQHGVSLDFNECDALSRAERQLVSDSMRRFFPPEINNLERLRRYRYVYIALLTKSATELLSGFPPTSATFYWFRHGLLVTYDERVGRVSLRSAVDLVNRRYLKLAFSDAADYAIDLGKALPSSTLLTNTYGSGAYVFSVGDRHTLFFMGDTGAQRFKFSGAIDIKSVTVDNQFPKLLYICAREKSTNARYVFKYDAELNSLERVNFGLVGDGVFFYTTLCRGEQSDDGIGLDFVITHNVNGKRYFIRTEIGDDPDPLRRNTNEFSLMAMVVPRKRGRDEFSNKLILVAFSGPYVITVDLPRNAVAISELVARTIQFPRLLAPQTFAHFDKVPLLIDSAVSFVATVSFAPGSAYGNNNTSRVQLAEKIIISFNYQTEEFAAMAHFSAYSDGKIPLPNRFDWAKPRGQSVARVVGSLFPRKASADNSFIGAPPPGFDLPSV